MDDNIMENNIVEPQEIAFTKVSLPFGWLGNMAPYPVKHEGKSYKTTEALFQALRFKDFPEVQELIMAEKSPMGCKMVAKSHFKLLNGYQPGCQEDLDNMRLCLRLKVDQHSELKEQLVATNDIKIIENCSSRPHGTGLIWGAAFQEGKWVGKNVLGVLWEELREQLKLELDSVKKPKM